MTWRERDHPRDPRTGMFVERGGAWLAAIDYRFGDPFTNDPYGRRRLLYAATNPDPDAVHGVFPGGETARVEFYHTAGGRSRVRKKFDAGLMDGYEENPMEAEVKASLVGEAIGAPVPAVVYDPDDRQTIHLAYSDGVHPSERNPEVREGAIESDAGVRLGLLDLLINNVDRKSDNWLIGPDGDPIGIDHALSGAGALDVNWLHPDVKGWGGFDSPFVRHFLEPDTDGEGRQAWRASNPLHFADVVEVTERMRRLWSEGTLTRSEFAQMAIILQALQSRARGTRRLIA